MLTYAVKRAVSSIPVVIIISLFVFLLMHLSPGDPVAMMLGESATEEDILRVREEWGLNDPILTQYGRFIGGALVGDFGDSMKYGEPVLDLLVQRLPATIELTVLALVIALLIAIPIGVYSAVHQNSLGDHLGMTAALFGISLPSFWFGTLLIFFFAGRLQWLPPSGRIPDTVSLQGITGFLLIDTLLQGDFAGFWMSLKHIILPAITLGASMAGILTRLTRSSMLDVLGHDFVRTARAKGAADRKVIWKHAFRNALVPIVTVLGLQMGFMLGGSIIIETVFAWPGLGRLLMDAVTMRDYILVQGSVLLLAVWFVVVNLIVDLTYAWIDPRIRYS